MWKSTRPSRRTSWLVKRGETCVFLCTVPYLFCRVTSMVVLALFWHRANCCKFVSQPYRTGWSVVMSLLEYVGPVYMVLYLCAWCHSGVMWIGTVSHTALVKYVEGTDTELMASMSQRSIERTVKVLKNRYSLAQLGFLNLRVFGHTWSPFHPNLAISIVPLIRVF